VRARDSSTSASRAQYREPALISTCSNLLRPIIRDLCVYFYGDLSDEFFAGGPHCFFQEFCRLVGVLGGAFYYYFVVDDVDEAGGGSAELVVQEAEGAF